MIIYYCQVHHHHYELHNLYILAYFATSLFTTFAQADFYMSSCRLDFDLVTGMLINMFQYSVTFTPFEKIKYSNMDKHFLEISMTFCNIISLNI